MPWAALLCFLMNRAAASGCGALGLFHTTAQRYRDRACGPKVRPRPNSRDHTLRPGPMPPPGDRKRSSASAGQQNDRVPKGQNAPWLKLFCSHLHSSLQSSRVPKQSQAAPSPPPTHCAERLSLLQRHRSSTPGRSRIYSVAARRTVGASAALAWPSAAGEPRLLLRPPPAFQAASQAFIIGVHDR